VTAPIQPGDVLAGKYRVERVLGVGGMGVVVAATHLQLDQLVALKFMLPEVLKNANHVTRFLREARAVVRLKGEHVTRVLDVGTLENGAPYIVMEYLEGDDLAGTLGKRGSLPIGEACAYIMQACEAMAEAHAQSIVHRDLKPQNLFLTRRPDGSPFVKVLDFGISKTSLSDTEGFQATHTSAMMGSPAYMSPEQIKSSKDVDARTDIWALGVILYQLVTGRVPFDAGTMVELCVRVLNHEPEPLRSVRPDVPPAFEAIVARCLRKDRADRYANIAELVADLAPFVPRAGIETLERVSRLLKVVPRITDPAIVAQASPASTNPHGLATTLGGAAGVSVTNTPAPRRRWALAAIATGVVVLGVIVFVATRSTDPQQPAVAPLAAPPGDRAAVVPAPDAAVPVAVPTIDAAPAPIAVPAIDAGVAPVVVTAKPKPKKLATVRPVTKPVTVVEPKQPDPEPVKPDPTQVPEPKKRDPFGSRR
jgi:serine/threonine-protein kinase